LRLVGEPSEQELMLDLHRWRELQLPAEPDAVPLDDLTAQTSSNSVADKLAGVIAGELDRHDHGRYGRGKPANSK
jgi:hypothetical protein